MAVLLPGAWSGVEEETDAVLVMTVLFATPLLRLTTSVKVLL